MGDVKNDDNGCFLTKQRYNNCYNYGTDILTNSFAQPGRRDFDGGDGLCSHSSRPCMPNTCEDVKKGALADGLTWVGTELPTQLPEEGHYVSLHIWPNSNFHWLRMDATMKWSHKPGGTAVRNMTTTKRRSLTPARPTFLLGPSIAVTFALCHPRFRLRSRQRQPLWSEVTALSCKFVLTL